MMITTKGKYALLFLVDIAKYKESGFVSLNDVSRRINVSKKYLEQIIPLLNKSGLIFSNRGFKGGYRLALAPSKITVLDILTAVENSFLKNSENEFSKINFIFEGLNSTVKEYLSKITIQDITDMENEGYYNYVI